MVHSKSFFFSRRWQSHTKWFIAKSIDADEFYAEFWQWLEFFFDSERICQVRKRIFREVSRMITLKKKFSQKFNRSHMYFKCVCLFHLSAFHKNLKIELRKWAIDTISSHIHFWQLTSWWRNYFKWSLSLSLRKQKLRTIILWNSSSSCLLHAFCKFPCICATFVQIFLYFPKNNKITWQTIRECAQCMLPLVSSCPILHTGVSVWIILHSPKHISIYISDQWFQVYINIYQ